MGKSATLRMVGQRCRRVLPAAVACTLAGGSAIAGPIQSPFGSGDAVTASASRGLRVDLLTPGFADPSQVIAALTGNGYSIVSISETLLHRIKIRAQNASHLREIVVSRASGQILRDQIVEDYRPPETPQVVPMVPIEELLKNVPGGIDVRTRGG